MRALGHMSSEDMRLKMMETIDEIEALRMENGEAGLDSRQVSLRDFCQSGGPSFRTAKDTVAEASAADLVEMGNVASGSGEGNANGDAGGASANGNGGGASANGNGGGGTANGNGGNWYSGSDGESGSDVPADIKGKGKWTDPDD